MRPLLDRLLAAARLNGRSTRTTLLKLILACLLASVALFVLQYEILSGRVRSEAGIERVRLLAAVLPWIGRAAFLTVLWLAIRRFHDQDRTGWLAFFPWAAAVALVEARLPAALVLLVWVGYLIVLFLPGTVGPNRYGPDPRGWKSPEHYEEERRKGRAR